MIRFLRSLLGRPGGPPPGINIEYINIHDLCLDDGVSYSFEAGFSSSVDAIYINRAMTISLEGVGYRVRAKRESGLGWATLLMASLGGPVREVRGSARGRPEDFTLSLYGVREGRAILKDELIWHPIPSGNLVEWGLRGDVGRFTVEYNPRCRGVVVAPGASTSHT